MGNIISENLTLIIIVVAAVVVILGFVFLKEIFQRYREPSFPTLDSEFNSLISIPTADSYSGRRRFSYDSLNSDDVKDVEEYTANFYHQLLHPSTPEEEYASRVFQNALMEEHFK